MAKQLKSSNSNAISSSSSERITVTIPASTMEVLRQMAADEGIAISEAARQAIKRDLGLRKLEKEGGKVLVQLSDGQTMIVMPNSF
ncbi:MAG: ribbon-helix-helix domain-containing protein [Cyanobacteria bacterium P01_F01_bin.53]